MRPRRYYLWIIGFLVAVAGSGLYWRFAHAQRVSTTRAWPTKEQTIRTKDGRVLHFTVPDGLPRASSPPVPRPAVSEVSFLTKNLRLQIITDSKRDLPTRLAAVNQLAKTPWRQDTLKETLVYLATPISDEPSAAQRERALRNELLNVLRRDPACAAAAVPALVRQAADADQDTGMRDYSLQHLASWIPDLPASEKTQAVSALQTALKYTDGTYAGTALIALNNLAGRNLLDGPFNTGSEARRIVLDDQYGILSRLSAFALVTELHVKDDALDSLARNWVSASFLPLGARRVAQAFLKTSASH